MKARRFLLIAAAVLCVLTLVSSAACRGKNKMPAAAENEPAITLKPEGWEPTPEPATEPARTEAAQEIDLAMFDKPLSDLCAVVEDPNVDSLKKLFPADFFDGLAAMLEQSLAASGLSMQNLGYDSFDAFIEATVGEMDFTHLITTYGIGDAERAEYKVNSAEPADAASVIRKLGTIINYIDQAKLTAAYKLNVDFTLYGKDGRTDTRNTDLIVYEYDGELYVAYV